MKLPQSERICAINDVKQKRFVFHAPYLTPQQGHRILVLSKFRLSVFLRVTGSDFLPMR